MIDWIVVMLAEYLPLVFVGRLIYLWLKHNDEDKELALIAGYSLILGMIINLVISLVYFHPRPFMMGLGTLLIHHSPQSSFPSDHTTFMFAIALPLLYAKSTKPGGMFLFCLGIVEGLARVYAGVHFPLDIVGALLVSLCSSVIIWRVKDELIGLNSYITGMYNRLTTSLYH